MNKFLRGFIRSLPVQLLLLHCRRYQVLLLFWLIVLGAMYGWVMKLFGAYSLFLVPEYLGNVNPLACAITGFAFGVFMMSWNVATFILFAKHLRFLASTSRPFLKYCINNAVLPLFFLMLYLFKAIDFCLHEELMNGGQIFINGLGFLAGLLICLAISFIYFFGADVTIVRSMKHVLIDTRKFKTKYDKEEKYTPFMDGFVKVEWFFSTRLRLRKTRSVAHYPKAFLEMIFNRHHISAVIAIVLSFISLLILGFFQDNEIFKIPAAASILLFFSLLIGGAAALTYWLQSWSLPLVLVLFVGVDQLMQHGVIDPRNKAYGLNYDKSIPPVPYNRDTILSLCKNEAADKKRMIAVLNRWKQKQGVEKPYLCFITVSGGGNRSAYFTMNVLQRLDSITGGELMKKTFMITGASGGMMGATYYRQLYAEQLKGNIRNRFDPRYAQNISKDLLNSLFSSFITRDLVGAPQRFYIGDEHYVKDRAYDFEQQLHLNTGGLLNRSFKELAPIEEAAQVPLCIFNATITADAKKMMLATLPLTYLMRTPRDTAGHHITEPDAVDFQTYFRNRHPEQLRLLTALRMNATFPYVLPNVWLPTEPKIDVMDAGLRDNFGQETVLRFVKVFEKWIKDNTAGVIMIQVRDRLEGGWQNPFIEHSLVGEFTRPFTFLQFNWYKLQDMYREELLNYGAASLSAPLKRFTFYYVPDNMDKTAALNFHLTGSEKKDIARSLNNKNNRRTFRELSGWLKQ